MYRLRAELETRNIEPELWNIVCVLDHICILRSPDNIRAAVDSGELTEEQGKELLDSALDVVIHLPYKTLVSRHVAAERYRKMNMFIFENADKVSDNYHEGGGLAIVAADIEQVKQLVEATNGTVRLSDDDIKKVIVYPLKGKHEAKIFAFPDAGCC